MPFLDLSFEWPVDEVGYSLVGHKPELKLPKEPTRTGLRFHVPPPVTTAGERWAANVELLRELTPYARRVEEVPVELRYNLLARESRFRPIQELRALLRFRGSRWPDPEERSAA